MTRTDASVIREPATSSPRATIWIRAWSKSSAFSTASAYVITSRVGIFPTTGRLERVLKALPRLRTLRFCGFGSIDDASVVNCHTDPTHYRSASRALGSPSRIFSLILISHQSLSLTH